MKKYFLAAFFVFIMYCGIFTKGYAMQDMILPKPKVKGNVSIEEVISKRRSVRKYINKEISVEDLSQILWACQGITDDERGLRSAPSAGALYPLEIYVVNKSGIFHYKPSEHKLLMTKSGDFRNDLKSASLGQSFINEVPVDIVICAVYQRVTKRYGDRGVRYTDIEVGHAAENVHLEAEALGLSSVPVGAFNDAEVSKVLELPADEKPLYIIPIGYAK